MSKRDDAIVRCSGCGINVAAMGSTRTNSNGEDECRVCGVERDYSIEYVPRSVKCSVCEKSVDAADATGFPPHVCATCFVRAATRALKDGGMTVYDHDAKKYVSKNES